MDVLHDATQQYIVYNALFYLPNPCEVDWACTALRTMLHILHLCACGRQACFNPVSLVLLKLVVLLHSGIIR